MTHHRITFAALAALALIAPAVPATAAHHRLPDRPRGVPSPAPTQVLALDGPRGVDALGGGRTLVAENDGSFSLVIDRRHDDARKIALSSVPATGIAPAISGGPHGSVYVLTGAGAEPGGPPIPGAATLYRWRPGDAEPSVVADIAAYQATDPDPDDQEGQPADSNPFGVLALRNGDVLVSDAAGNDVLRVHGDGTIETVARLRPRTVLVPEGLPPGTPPAGTPIVSEAVATSIAVDRRGDLYIGELRGFPATPGTSQIWRVPVGSTDAVCDPADPQHGACQRVADGLTSIVDLAADGRGSIYAVSLSAKSWLAMELGVPGADVGSLLRVRPCRGSRELFTGSLTLPGGVDVAGNDLYLTGPVFGPGALSRARLRP
ncbi:ScyD/ScyE family protein [Nocardioides sp. GXZ039]|uniref:ScyD/ScyE family protein n=1 Tax=Nocardioides sp. GXZ039 TaxID=3136018 RepID=UPI0030F3918A